MSCSAQSSWIGLPCRYCVTMAAFSCSVWVMGMLLYHADKHNAEKKMKLIAYFGNKDAICEKLGIDAWDEN